MQAAERPRTPGTSLRPCRVLLLVNPASRRGREVLAAVTPLLEAQGMRVRLGKAASREDVGRLIERAADEVDAVVVGGGDGSLNAVLPALLRTRLPLGVLPLGTANDFARTVGVPADLRAAVAVIASGVVRRVDVGSVNGHPFLNVASLGLSTDLAERLTGAGKRRWGRLSYAAAALGVLARARPFRAIIVAKDRAARVKTYQIAVGNGRYYGGGLPVRHDACVADGGSTSTAWSSRRYGGSSWRAWPFAAGATARGARSATSSAPASRSARAGPAPSTWTASS